MAGLAVSQTVKSHPFRLPLRFFPQNERYRKKEHTFKEENNENTS